MKSPIVSSLIVHFSIQGFVPSPLPIIILQILNSFTTQPLHNPMPVLSGISHKGPFLYGELLCCCLAANFCKISGCLCTLGIIPIPILLLIALAIRRWFTGRRPVSLLCLMRPMGVMYSDIMLKFYSSHINFFILSLELGLRGDNGKW